MLIFFTTQPATRPLTMFLIMVASLRGCWFENSTPGSGGRFARNSAFGAGGARWSVHGPNGGSGPERNGPLSTKGWAAATIDTGNRRLALA